MNKILILSLAMTLAACTTTSNSATRTPASIPMKNSRSVVGNTPKAATQVAVYSDACDPRTSPTPLEMIVDYENDTLSLEREGTVIEGFPVFAVASGFPEYYRQSPRSLASNVHNDAQDAKIVVDNGFVIEGSKYATNYRQWSESRQYSYKSRQSGTLSVDPRQMEKVWNCAKNFAASEIKITTR